MTKEEKKQLIETLTAQLLKYDNIYIADTNRLNAEKTSQLRRLCFKREVTLTVVKNTLLKKAMENSGKDFSELFPVLKGSSSILLSNTSNAPAKLIQDFRKKAQIPVLKGAYIQAMCFIGDNQLEVLATLKSKNELIADVILALQSPMQKVLGGLQSGGQTIAGVLKTLSEKAA